MNKEEIEYMFETLTKQWGDTDNYVNDLLSYSKNLQQENQELKKDIKNIIRILNKNCDDLEATEEEFESLEKWNK